MADTGPSRILLVLLVVIILAGAGIAAWVVNYELTPQSIAAPTTVQVGDNITVNYIGEYANGTQQGKVFDTSIYSVYANNATYPKSLQYTPHGNRSADFTPLPITITPGNHEYNINGTNYTSVVTGFWQGILGMQVNQTRWVTFPDSLGYGPLDPACTASVPLTFTVPVLRTVPTSQFSTEFPGVTPGQGVTFTDPAYGWTDVVFTMNATDITVEGLTSIGFVAPLTTGWNATVTGVNATTISLRDDITPQNYGGILGTLATARPCGGGSPTSTFTILSVNLANGTFLENWNSPVTGFSLTFRITIVQFVST
jgi:FKBP-type peptidyl-prolyl cis-trans isomerase 2